MNRGRSEKVVERIRLIIIHKINYVGIYIFLYSLPCKDDVIQLLGLQSYINKLSNYLTKGGE